MTGNSLGPPIIPLNRRSRNDQRFMIRLVDGEIETCRRRGVANCWVDHVDCMGACTLAIESTRKKTQQASKQAASKQQASSRHKSACLASEHKPCTHIHTECTPSVWRPRGWSRIRLHQPMVPHRKLPRKPNPSQKTQRRNGRPGDGGDQRTQTSPAPAKVQSSQPTPANPANQPPHPGSSQPGSNRMVRGLPWGRAPCAVPIDQPQQRKQIDGVREREVAGKRRVYVRAIDQNRGAEKVVVMEVRTFELSVSMYDEEAGTGMWADREEDMDTTEARV